jgi:hypothetical protein
MFSALSGPENRNERKCDRRGPERDDRGYSHKRRAPGRSRQSPTQHVDLPSKFWLTRDREYRNSSQVFPSRPSQSRVETSKGARHSAWRHFRWRREEKKAALLRGARGPARNRLARLIDELPNVFHPPHGHARAQLDGPREAAGLDASPPGGLADRNELENSGEPDKAGFRHNAHINSPVPNMKGVEEMLLEGFGLIAPIN